MKKPSLFFFVLCVCGLRSSDCALLRPQVKDHNLAVHRDLLEGIHSKSSKKKQAGTDVLASSNEAAASHHTMGLPCLVSPALGAMRGVVLLRIITFSRLVLLPLSL